ncbi:MAG: hypothetical protein V4585_15525 [Bacteroidota bacterium]
MDNSNLTNNNSHESLDSKESKAIRGEKNICKINYKLVDLV